MHFKKGFVAKKVLLTTIAGLMLVAIVPAYASTDSASVPPDIRLPGIILGSTNVYDDCDSAITYKGSWVHNTYANRYAGTQTFSNHPGDTASFSFSGTQVTYIYALQGNLGFAQVSIDGTVLNPIDEYSGESFGRQMATYGGLTNATHTITITVAGNANPNASDHNVVIDGFIAGAIPANSGVYDDRDPSLIYKGSSWLQNPYPNRLAGTQTFSNHPGDSVSFTFTGTQVTYVYARQNNLGFAQISIDGTVVDPLDEYSAEFFGQQVATYAGLTNSTHTITITVAGNANPSALDHYIVIDGFFAGTVPASSGIRDDRDPTVTYSGSWVENPYPNRFAGTQTFSNHTNDTASFSFTGTQVTYIYARQNNLGFAQVSIDGNLFDPIDQYSAEYFGQQMATYAGLTNGPHTITITVMGNANPNAHDHYVIIDGFIAATSKHSVAAKTGSGIFAPSQLSSTAGGSTPTSSTSVSASMQMVPQLRHGAGNANLSNLVGDCVTDDTVALQNLLDSQNFIFLPRPIGGCYLVSKTLILRAGDFLFGASANNPNSGDPARGVVIKLAPNSNVSLLQTFDSHDSPGGGNEFMCVENVVFDGNGSQQTRELQGEALVDFRGTFIQTFLRHTLIINAFGTALFTGSTELDNVWIMASSTSTYAWIHNPGKTGLGALLVNQVYVEESMVPNSGQYRSPWSGGVNDPSAYAHAIWFNGLSSATINQLHCESAATCLDFNDVQTLTIHGISGCRIGNPLSSDPTDQYLIRAMNLNAYNLTFSAAYFDQSGTAYTGQFPNSRVFGLARGLTSNDMFETPQGKTTWPLYTWGLYSQGFSGVPYLGERPIVSNELWIQQVGDYSPNRLAIWDNKGGPSGSYAYFERNGSQLNLGFSPGPWDANEVTMFQMNFYGVGNSGNNVQINGGRLQTGTEDNTDMAGELSLSVASSAIYSFAGYYLVHPQCTVTPQFDIGSNNHFWITYPNALSFILNFALPVTGTVSYTCTGRK